MFSSITPVRGKPGAYVATPSSQRLVSWSSNNTLRLPELARFLFTNDVVSRSRLVGSAERIPNPPAEIKSHLNTMISTLLTNKSMALSLRDLVLGTRGGPPGEAVEDGVERELHVFFVKKDRELGCGRCDLDDIDVLERNLLHEAK